MPRLPAPRSRNAIWMIAGFSALIVMTLIAITAFVYQEHGSNAVRHTVEVDGRLSRVLSSVQDAETGQRGFLLTGDESFLVPFTASAATLELHLGALETLIRDDAEQRAQLLGLTALIRDKLKELQTTIDLRREGDRAVSDRLVAEGHGKTLMDAIRMQVAGMEEHEAGLMEARQASVSRIAFTVWIIVAALVVLLVVMATSAIREAGRRANLARFLPRELASRLADDDDSLRAGRRQNAAVAFVDMRGSTALAENLDPHRLSQFLSAFRRRITRLARLHGGVVDKFIGDGALIVFGLPEPKPDDAARALAFAEDLVAVIARWNVKRGHAEPVRIGIGIHYGDLFCGIIGEEARYEFTVLGDTVNVAARLEQATKAHGVPVLASEAARDAAGPAGRAWFEVGREPLRGRREAMPYYSVAPAEAAVAAPETARVA